MSIEQHIKVLENFTSDTLLGKTKIYFLDVIEKTAFYLDPRNIGKIKSFTSDKLGSAILKIGDTFRLVDQRNRETLTNASLHKESVFSALAEKEDGSEFRDYDFHTFLEDKGYERELNDQGQPSEFFFITLEQALEELELFIKKPVRKEVILRTAQHYLADQEQKAIDEGNQYVNADYCMRSGKTIISLDVAKNNDWMPVYLGKNLTSQNSAEQDNDKFGIVPHMTTESLHGPDNKELEEGEVSDKIKKIIDSINEKNKLNQKLAFYVDEADDGSHTAKSIAVMAGVIGHFKKTGQFVFMKPMTGTRSHLGLKILKIIADGNPIKELSLAYWEMQILEPDTTCKRNYRNISFYSKDASGLSNISDAMKNRTDGHKSLASAIVGILGTNGFDLYENPDFPHWFMKFATSGKNNANALVKYLNRNCKTVEGVEHHYQAINGDITSNREAEKFCKKVIKQQRKINPDIVVVFITQGMATTSFSVETILNSVVFSDNPITADDVQAMHRSATWSPGKDECNMLRVTTNDSNEFCWDSPFENEMKDAKDRNSRIILKRQLLKQNSMIHYVIGDDFESPYIITEENAQDVVDEKLKRSSSITHITSMVMDTFDEDMLAAIVETKLKSKSTNRKSNTDKGEHIDPFNKKQTTTTNSNPSNKLTKNAEAKIVKAFVESAVNVPAIAREQQTTMEGLNSWYDIGIEKDLFFDVYNSSTDFKDRIDSIYNLCKEPKYLVENYIDKLV
jgi:hypothetical protein